MPVDKVGSANDNVLFTSVMLVFDAALIDVLNSNITESREVIT